MAHNAITVFDPKDCWRDTSSDCALRNDGGQRWPLRRYTPPFPAEEFGVNRLWSATLLEQPDYREQFVTAVRTVDFEPQFDYVNSDATKAYTNQWSRRHPHPKPQGAQASQDVAAGIAETPRDRRTGL